jgi:hypothetical protein
MEADLLPTSRARIEMTVVATAQLDGVRKRESTGLLRELRETHESLQACFGDLDKVLAKPTLDASALTSIRLKLAGMRLSRGPLITRVSEFLSGQVTETEAATLDELRLSHQRLLQIATTHTGKWTLQAIAEDWPQYRVETRQLIARWIAKSEQEQRLVYPLVERCSPARQGSARPTGTT